MCGASGGSPTADHEIRRSDQLSWSAPREALTTPSPDLRAIHGKILANSICQETRHADTTQTGNHQTLPAWPRELSARLEMARDIFSMPNPVDDSAGMDWHQRRTQFLKFRHDVLVAKFHDSIVGHVVIQ